MLNRQEVDKANALKLAQNFTLYEMIHSDGHPELVVYPDQDIIDQLTGFASKVLQPIRDAVGPLKISSGWRNEKLNAAVGGEKGSVHQIKYKGVILGVASDIMPRQLSEGQTYLEKLLATYKWIWQNMPNVKTLILYRKSSVTKTPFIHVDTRSGRVGRAAFEKMGPGNYVPFNWKELD